MDGCYESKVSDTQKAATRVQPKLGSNSTKNVVTAAKSKGEKKLGGSRKRA